MCCSTGFQKHVPSMLYNNLVGCYILSNYIDLLLSLSLSPQQPLESHLHGDGDGDDDDDDDDDGGGDDDVYIERERAPGFAYALVIALVGRRISDILSLQGCCFADKYCFLTS